MCVFVCVCVWMVGVISVYLYFISCGKVTVIIEYLLYIRNYVFCLIVFFNKELFVIVFYMKRSVKEMYLF